MTDPATDPIPEDRDQGGRAVPFLLAVAAIVAAIVTARAALLASDATSDWQASVGDEQRRGAILLQGVRYTYGVEGSQALMILSAEARAQALRDATAGQPPEIVTELEREAAVQQQVADLVGPSSELIADPRYRLPSGAVDLQLRLADSRTPDDVAIDPIATLGDGDAAADRASRLMLATLAIAGAFLFGALAQTFRGRRRQLLGLGWAALALGSLAAIAIELGVVGVSA